jgi:hypothetical protein
MFLSVFIGVHRWLDGLCGGIVVILEGAALSAPIFAEADGSVIRPYRALPR